MGHGARLTCPQCSKEFEPLAHAQPGARVRCPHCGADASSARSLAAQATLAGTPDDRRVTLTLASREGPTLTRPADATELSVEGPLAAGGQASGRYVEQGVIAHGGMGEIVLCIDRDTRRTVAMKRMLAATAQDPGRRARFIEEAQVTAQLEHPNIVPVHELTRREDGSVYFTMKLVKGKSLADIIRDIRDQRDHKDHRDTEGNVAQPPSAVGMQAGRRGGSPCPPSAPTGAAPAAEEGRHGDLPLRAHITGPSAEGDPPTLGDLLQVFLKVCDGVAFAHSRGVIHRDLKPANIMVGDFGEVLVMDWGLAKIIGREDQVVGAGPRARPGDVGAGPCARPAQEGGQAQGPAPTPSSPTRIVSDRQEMVAMHTVAGSMMGTPAYMSPEQAKGELDKVDERSDIYSLGAILYEILTLERAVQGDDAIHVLFNVIKGNIVPPERRFPDRAISRELSAIAMRCLHKNRPHRYRSVLDLKRDIGLYLEGRGVSAAPDTFTQAVVKVIKRNKGISASIAAAAVVLVAVTAFFLINLKRQRDDAISARATAEGERKAAQEARDRQRATALAASRELAEQAVRAADAGHFAEADLRADGAVKVMPDGPWGHYALAMIARQRLDTRTARGLLEKALSFDASHDQSRAALSQLLAQAGDVAKASALASRLDQVTDWRSLASAGEALMAAGKYQDGVKAYDRAIALMEKDPTVLPQASAEKKKAFGEQIEEMRRRLFDARAEAACVGFYESIRKLPAEEQGRRIDAKFTEIHAVGIGPRFTVENGVITGVGIPGGPARWLQPLRGMPLVSLCCESTQISDLNFVRGMPLTTLDCHNTRVSDLGPLKDMPLTSLDCSSTKVSDLGSLKGMALTSLNCAGTRVSDLGPLKGMSLTSLICGYTQISDLGPLKGLPLTRLDCCTTRVSDLSPLKGMALTSLDCSATQVSDLGPLKGMPLTSLACADSRVRDLDPLKGMPLTSLSCGNTQVSDLGPLKGMPLTSLNCSNTQVGDLGPLKGMALTSLNCDGTKVSDLGPLEGMKLEVFTFTPKSITKGVERVRGMKTMREIGDDVNRCTSPEEFWKKYDAGEFK